MTAKKKKEFILNVVKHEGCCLDAEADMSSTTSCRKRCILTGKPECFSPTEAYKIAVVWMKRYYPDDLLEFLI